MTIGDYIKEKLSIWSVEYSDGIVELELSKLQLNPSETITGETNLDLFFYNVIPDLLSRPSSVSEGGFSVSYDKKAMISYYQMLAKKLGKNDYFAQNTITDITNQW